MTVQDRVMERRVWIASPWRKVNGKVGQRGWMDSGEPKTQVTEQACWVLVWKFPFSRMLSSQNRHTCTMDGLITVTWRRLDDITKKASNPCNHYFVAIKEFASVLHAVYIMSRMVSLNTRMSRVVSLNAYYEALLINIRSPQHRAVSGGMRPSFLSCHANALWLTALKKA